MDLSTSQTEFQGEQAKGLVFQQEELAGRSFLSCTFVKCNLRETTFSDCTFEDCSFRHCDLSLVVLKDCTFKNTLFEDSQLLGVNWLETNLAQQKYLLAKPVDFLRCALNHSVFMGLNLEGARLSECVARDVSFEDANLTRADCRGTDFAESRFLHTNLAEADFSGATNYAIAANLNTLKKTKFSLPEAMSLLYSLDIVLTE